MISPSPTKSSPKLLFIILQLHRRSANGTSRHFDQPGIHTLPVEDVTAPNEFPAPLALFEAIKTNDAVVLHLFGELELGELLQPLRTEALRRRVIAMVAMDRSEKEGEEEERGETHEEEKERGYKYHNNRFENEREEFGVGLWRWM